MTAWMEQPANTMVADFEYIISPGAKLIPLQVAIADGYGKWIIPPTTIDHGITKGAFLDKTREISSAHRHMGSSMIHKFYPGGLDEMTKGMTCQEIADLIDQHVKVCC